jgi:hypothetical protein
MNSQTMDAYRCREARVCNPGAPASSAGHDLDFGLRGIGPGQQVIDMALIYKQ